MTIRGVCTCENDLWHWVIADQQIVLVCTNCGKELGLALAYPATDLLTHALKVGATK